MGLPSGAGEYSCNICFGPLSLTLRMHAHGFCVFKSVLMEVWKHQPNWNPTFVFWHFIMQG